MLNINVADPSADGMPPWVTFEQRPVEDRAASIANGIFTEKDVDFVIVRQPGTKNTHEAPAEEWLREQERQAGFGRIPREWPVAFRKLYAQYKAGVEPTPDGAPIRNWPAISKAQAQNFIRIGIVTVEQLAAANEEALSRIGMGGREAKQKAQAYLLAADRNKAAMEIQSLRVELQNRDARIEGLEDRLRQIESRLGSEASPVGVITDEDEESTEGRPRRRRG